MPYAEDASKGHRAYRAAIAAAQAFTDPDLTAEAIQKKQLDMKQAAEAAWAKTRQDIDSAATARHATASAAAGEQRPKIDDHSQISNSWRMVERLLDSGRTIREVVAKAKGPMLLAIREYGQDYLESTTERPPLGQEPTALSDVSRLVDARLIELDDPAASYIAGEREAKLDLDLAQVYTRASAADTPLALAVKADYIGKAGNSGDEATD